MIEKTEFYHGAALVRLIEDPRCEAIRKHGCGYRVNQQRFVAIKYSTKARSPWGFSFSQEDIVRFEAAMKEFGICLIALVCGGDGVCAISWSTVSNLLGGTPGWISAKRVHGSCYGVSGPAGTLNGKIAMKRWPGSIFDEEGGD
jgi:hypothetical protein